MPHRRAILHKNQTIYSQLTEKVLVSRIFFLVYSYLPVIDPSSPAEGEGYFPSNSNILHPQPP
jgi:hypothetical protein